MFDYLDGSNLCPPKYVENGVTKKFTIAYREWIKTNKALLSLLIATLENKAIEYLIRSKIAH